MRTGVPSHRSVPPLELLLVDGLLELTLTDPEPLIELSEPLLLKLLELDELDEKLLLSDGLLELLLLDGLNDELSLLLDEKLELLLDRLQLWLLLHQLELELLGLLELLDEVLVDGELLLQLLELTLADPDGLL